MRALVVSFVMTSSAHGEYQFPGDNEAYPWGGSLLDYVDITRFRSSLSGSELDAYIHVDEWPFQFLWDRNTVPVGEIEYSWVVAIDVDGSASTGTPASYHLRGIDYEIRSEHIKTSQSQHYSTAGPALLTTKVWKYNQSTGQFSVFSDATMGSLRIAQPPNEVYFIRLTGVIPGIKANSKLYARTSDYLTGSDYTFYLSSPSVAAPTSSSIGSSTAILGANVTNDGGDTIFSRGIVFSSTTTNNNPSIGGVGVTVLNASGTTGSFTVNATGLEPSAAYSFRAYATNAVGTAYSTGSSFVTLSALANWRQVWYGSSTNSGDAADGADPYKTGLANLLVFAFFGPNQNPIQARISNLPRPQVVGGRLTYSFSAPSGVSGISYSAEWSDSLLSNDWHNIPDMGSGVQHIFSVDLNNNIRRFTRLRIISP